MSMSDDSAKRLSEHSGQEKSGEHSRLSGPKFFRRRIALPQRFRRRTRPGEVPGRVEADPEAEPPTIHVMGYSSAEVVEGVVEDISQLDEYLAKFPITWINIDGLADAKLIQALGTKFGLHPLTLEDVVNVHQRAKVEDYDDYLFLVARMIALQEDEVQTEQISMFLGDNYLLTFQERKGDCLDPVRTRIRKKRGKIRTRGADYLAYAVLDAVVDGYFPVVESLSRELEQLDAELDDKNLTTNTTARIHRLRRDLLLVQRSIWPHREAVNEFSHLTGDWITDETRIFLRDCYDHVIQLVEIVETYREMCADVRDVYVSEISLRMNAVMKFLTLIATIFIPLNFLAALYGMNFNTRYEWNMPELGWPYGYPLLVLLMVGIGVGMLFYFWRKGWLRE